jgi:hypothetical protein
MQWPMPLGELKLQSAQETLRTALYLDAQAQYPRLGPTDRRLRRHWQGMMGLHLRAPGEG